MAVIADNLRPVAAYTQRAIALFRINCTFAEKFDRSFNDWNVAAFRDYGSMAKAHCALPVSAAVDILDSGLQLFTPVANDKSIAGWEIGNLTGASNLSFYQSYHLGKHTSGSAAGSELVITAVSDTTYTIPGTNITKPATNVTVTVDSGKTIVANDLGDIGQSTGLKMIRPVGHEEMDIAPQIRVVEASNASVTSIVLKVFPALKAPASGVIEPDTNMSRPIDTKTDKLHIVGDHKRGVIWLNDYAKFAMPKLPDMKPFPSHTASDPNSAVSVRMCTGAQFGKGQTASVLDCLYGGTMVPEGGMIICLPA